MLSLISVVVVLMATGCAEPVRVKPDLEFKEWRARAESARGVSPVAKKHQPGPLDEKTILSDVGETEMAPPTRRLPTRKTTLRLQDTHVAAILRALARSVDLNILVNDSVKGKATLNVKQVPWDQLFNGILRSHGLTYAWEGSLLRVMTEADMERDLKRQTASRDLKLIQPLRTHIVPVNYADEEKLKATLSKFLSTTKDGKRIGSIMVDTHTRALVIQAVDEDMAILLDLIDRLDRPIPQVLIEANIIEANREVARQLGVQWGGLAAQKGTVNHYLTAGANSSGIMGNTLQNAIDPTSGMVSNFPANLSDGKGLAIGYVAENIGGNILNVQLSALQEEGKLNILSSPSVTTIDNQTAFIESGTNVPFQTVSKDGNINIDWKEAVLKLEVKPNVIDTETVKLKIKTNKDELDFSNSVAGNPTIITKKAETSVILLDGQTTVIGGLNKETRQRSDSGVPYLKDVPVLGLLFKGSSHSDTMEDILIFITPHILKPATAAAETEPAVKPDTEPADNAPPAADAGASAGEKTAPDSVDSPASGKDEAIASAIAMKKSEPAVMPQIIGRVSIRERETLWDLIRTVYGEYSPALLGAVLRVNPQIRNPDALQVGQVVYFPAVINTRSPLDKKFYWIRVARKQTLAQAVQYVRAWAGSPKLRVLPCWGPAEGLGFPVVTSGFFLTAAAAEASRAQLAPELAEDAAIIRDWGQDTVFFKNPFEHQ